MAKQIRLTLVTSGEELTYDPKLNGGRAFSEIKEWERVGCYDSGSEQRYPFRAQVEER